ncbi:hypothetical protein D5687_09505 [Guyparkeria sp. SCN-R1]|nr:hypothetical protein D5687_09505 [Guyparkeria sp. SCN-R1]
MQRMSRRELVEALAEFGVGKDFTIRDLAELVGSDDYPVRGAFAWCIKARIVEPSGEVTRRTSRGKPYKAVTYRWTGSTRATRYTQPVPVNAECEAWLRGA